MPEFYHPERETLKHGADLPHWQQGEVMQFVTFRLADSMPQSKLRTWKEDLATWKKLNPEPWTEKQSREYHQRFTWKLEHWLDEGHGACILKQPANRSILEETLMHDQDIRAIHLAWVIMPNHVHLLFTPKHPLDKLLQSWKGISSRRIAQGPIWQKNYRDTLIRDAQHFTNAVRYIRRNPSKLKLGTFTLWESERAAAI
jgi:REP element-mobilizing transposase RayT